MLLASCQKRPGFKVEYTGANAIGSEIEAQSCGDDPILPSGSASWAKENLGKGQRTFIELTKDFGQVTQVKIV